MFVYLVYSVLYWEKCRFVENQAFNHLCWYNEYLNQCSTYKYWISYETSNLLILLNYTIILNIMDKWYLIHSDIDAFNISESQSALLQNVKMLEVEQGPGDMLFIPSGWFHQVILSIHDGLHEIISLAAIFHTEQSNFHNLLIYKWCPFIQLKILIFFMCTSKKKPPLNLPLFPLFTYWKPSSCCPK